jgi:hypothetical protein
VKISVIIPLYNKAATIDRALASVLEQSHAANEIVVVDDGSHDEGIERISKFNDPRIRLIQQPNSGVSAARNRGIDAATGDVLAFLDADDHWLPGHLRAIAALADSHPHCDVFGTSYLIRTGHGADRHPLIRACHFASGIGAAMPNYFAIASRSDPPFCSSSVAVTKRAMQSVGGFPLGIPQGEDLLTWARLAARFQIAYCPSNSAIVWQPDFGSAQPTRRPEKDDQVARALIGLLAGVCPAERGSLMRYISLWHKMRGSMYLALRDCGAARREFRHAMKYHPMATALWAKYGLSFLPQSSVRHILTLWLRISRRSAAA